MDGSGREIERRLREDRVVWLSTVRPDGRPHVTPVWFVFDDDVWWIGCARHSVKARNVGACPQVALALEGGDAPVVAEGRAVLWTTGFPAAVVGAFARKYGGWDVATDDGTGPRVLVEVPTERWLLRGVAG
ncbi:pyridoxamine 5'-phosphate oxidase family protein [Pseudonocardia sp. HH130630-07]|uniref:pyridoxamine 5'-phosphate oxidase family protein n=1 Tax=Pseudonocardia sp. HH130630-07 TaxID=1690815 RepID=UPI000814FC9A|nr:pyridoxamine 5'-phosphate oxidase family protein [Pseudonocardia sp. HH130630-07]ANY06065.1 pyridoxamine 5'-phosphate oxidase [Pseudonocardia sp. HH130630-07]